MSLVECAGSSGSCWQGALGHFELRSRSCCWWGGFYSGDLRSGHCEGHLWCPELEVPPQGLDDAGRAWAGIKENEQRSYTPPHATRKGSPSLGCEKGLWKWKGSDSDESKSWGVQCRCLLCVSGIECRWAQEWWQQAPGCASCCSLDVPILFHLYFIAVYLDLVRVALVKFPLAPVIWSTKSLSLVFDSSAGFLKGRVWQLEP